MKRILVLTALLLGSLFVLLPIASQEAVPDPKASDKDTAKKVLDTLHSVRDDVANLRNDLVNLRTAHDAAHQRIKALEGELAKAQKTNLEHARQIAALTPWRFRPQLGDVYTNSIAMKLKWIPPGKFLMGSKDRSPDQALHEVEITHGYYIGVYEVTLGQFRQFVKQSGYQAKDGDQPWEGSKLKQTEDHPVVNVTWNDATAFCAWLSNQENKNYALPTEAQWEYACRAGSAAKFCNGNDEDSLNKVAWHANNSGGQTQPVGKRAPNKWGLHDMHGNVWEWCEDWYRTDYEKLPAKNPINELPGERRVYRGGSRNLTAEFCTSSRRDELFAHHKDPVGGFRVVLLSP